jgi:Mlc titration factor MtfA (ptsG expression regulator)
MADLLRLRAMSALFLDQKEFSAAGALVLTDAMAVAIAAQACVPVLHLGLHWYDGFVGIVLHPQEVSVEREWTDGDGVVHRHDEVLAGEAMPGGPMMLSWHDVELAGDPGLDGYNVVIHEFMHIIDLRDGSANGIPPQPDAAAARHWHQVLSAEHARLCAAIERAEPTFLDPYAAQGLEEFFPVAAETFFASPRGLRQHHPAVYVLFASYFRQDPARFAR